MKQITRAAGVVRIRLPDNAGDVTDLDSSGTASKRSSQRSRNGPHAQERETPPSADELDIMLDALIEEESPISNPFEVLDRFAVDVGNGAVSTTSGKRDGQGSRASADKQELNIDLDLSVGESAVVLVEQDGTYEWHYPAGFKELVQRRGSNTKTGHTSIAFRIPIGSGGRLPRPSRGRRTHRGPITSFIQGKIQGFILKFVAKKTVGALTRRLERGVSEGPVVVNSASDATQWVHQSSFPMDALPTDRASRILLLVHGTFSSTLGSYGALTAYQEGQTLLQEALTHYDLVIGFDHYTLSETPEQNAEALLTSLLPLLANGQALELDAIAFSRGGLVYRYLSEILIPDAQVAIVCRTAVFVGCTNNGTELANDENWKHLIDFYTNMIAGATRLIGYAPGAALPTRILRQGIKVIGSLVTYIAQDGVANNSVPGVAAMEPAGEFVTALNALPSNRVDPGARAYYAIGSNFEPGDNEDAFKLGKTLVLKVADGFVDKLMGRDNDLVVNNDSMFVIDPVASARLVEKRSVNANGRIYHTVYFHQPMVANVCGKWLGILESQLTRRQVDSNQTITADQSPPRNWWADAVTGDFVQLPILSSVAEAKKRLKAVPASMVILQRLHQGELLYYGFTRTSLLSAMQGTTDPHVSLADLLGLHEWQARSISLDEALTASSATALRNHTATLGPEQGLPGSDLAVITDNAAPIGVVFPALDDSQSSHESAMPRAAAAPPRRGSRAPVTISGGEFESASTAATGSEWESATTPAAPEPETVWCHMHALMPEEVKVGSTASLEVTLSRDLIARETGISGAGEVAPDRALIIQVLARKHCDVVGSDRIELAVPDAGDEIPVIFDIKALHAGVGEIDIFARQGNQPIITLKLRPRFIQRTATPSTRTAAVTGTLQPVAYKQELPDILYIYDVQVGQQRILEFNFQARNLGVQGRYRSEPFKTDDARQAYISNLYTEIEEFWADDENDYDSFMQHLMARGANLFDKLVPKEVQALLWNARDEIKGIQVYSDDPFIPWELLYLKQPGKPAKADSCFLVEKGLFRWVSNTRYAPTRIRLRGGAFKHIIPKYPSASGYALAGAQAERMMLESEFSAKTITATSKAVKQALVKPEENDILHFACHGLAESSSIWNSGLLMKGKMVGGSYVQDDLSYEWTSMFADLHSLEASGPLVFLNACQSGRQGYNLTGTGGFAQAFINAGASAFIGSHWSVGDQPALEFSETFYRELIENGHTIMDAVSKARTAAKNKQEVTWLAYAVYADPYARIVHQ